MSVPPGTRELVRRRAGHRCEFCGVHETDAGGELTVDHYRPGSRGGTDHPDNLIYACSRCNLYKHDYWPESADVPRLWNPRRESLSAHFVERPDGTLEPRSSTGAFTLRKLRLNRPQLVAHRYRRRGVEASVNRLGLLQGIAKVQGQLLAEQAALAEQQNELLQELRALLTEVLES